MAIPVAARVVVGTRGSALARWQTDLVLGALRRDHPGIDFAIEEIRTLGDKITDAPLARIGDKGLFVREIERALETGQIDLAVHSLKDLPSVLEPPFALGAVLEREDPRDVLVSRQGLPFADLPRGARIGTSSLRRAAQLRALRPDLEIVNLRGNLDTRLRKAQTAEYDAVVLAAAGIKRLGQAVRITEYLAPEVCLPAVGQGAIAVEIRAGDRVMAELTSGLDHPPTHVAVRAERGFLARLEGGCQVPVAGHATMAGDTLTLSGLIASVDGSSIVRGRTVGPAERARELGDELAARLLADGGMRILEEVRG